MTKKMFEIIKNYMIECMQDSAHDSEHIFRVLYTAIHIANEIKEGINFDILIAACLLHDIGRNEQFINPELCHAIIGGIKAKIFLIKNNWSESQAEHVNQCIATHRFRGDNYPESIEAKILFDADKLDVVGCLGIVRTLLYKGQVGEPIYSININEICEGKNHNDPESFYKEYNFKLKNLYSKFYTNEGKHLAIKRRKVSEIFFEDLQSQINEIYSKRELLKYYLIEL